MINLRNLWLVVFAVVFVWSAISPYDRFTWWLEVMPALIGLAVLALTFKNFRLTGLVYFLVLVHCVILMVGGHYTYAEVPLFNDIRDWLGSSRNDYDKLGHFVQGFVPAMVTREIVIRKKVINGAKWRAFFIVCFCLAFSALYELIEWWVAVWSGEGAASFLGTQGYVWDTQADMCYAMVGAIVGLLLLGKYRDGQLRRLSNKRV